MWLWSFLGCLMAEVKLLTTGPWSPWTLTGYQDQAKYGCGFMVKRFNTHSGYSVKVTMATTTWTSCEFLPFMAMLLKKKKKVGCKIQISKWFRCHRLFPLANSNMMLIAPFCFILPSLNRITQMSSRIDEIFKNRHYTPMWFTEERFTQNSEIEKGRKEAFWTCLWINIQSYK